jgi:hypothetical protein
MAICLVRSYMLKAVAQALCLFQLYIVFAHAVKLICVTFIIP